MARVCTICQHKQREEIESALQRGEALRSIAGHFGTSKTALHRHKENCLPMNLTIRGSIEVIEDGKPDPLQRVEDLISRLEKMGRKLEQPSKAPLFFQGARELVRAMELAERMKAHYLEKYLAEKEKQRREENSDIQILAKDTILLREIQQAVDRAEARLNTDD